MFAYDNLILFNQLQSCLPTVATWQINPSTQKYYIALYIRRRYRTVFSSD